MDLRTVATAFLLLPASLAAQLLPGQFTWKNRPVQVHGFASQGFAKSDHNNYLTMRTSQGSFAFTDAGVNSSIQLSAKLRVGAQLYIRNIGTLGRWHPIIDWAVADYQFKNWFGVRAGKVKTVLGLYNDTQDMGFLHTWAILPQSLYPLDLRSAVMSHLGGDLYGEINLPEDRGSLAYTVYAGRRFDDKYGGYRDVSLQTGARPEQIQGWMAGADLRWNNPAPGLTLGASWLHQPFSGTATLLAFNLPTRFDVDARSTVFYADYQRGNLHVNGEYTRLNGGADITGFVGLTYIRQDSRGWYTALAYRVAPRVELGAYHSRFISNASQRWDDPANHIFDQAITARVEITRQWSFKVEGHFIDGYGSPFSARGFYLGQNPNGFERKTNMIVLRTGYTF